MTKPEKYVHVQRRVELENRRDVIHSIDVAIELLRTRIPVEEVPHTEAAEALQRRRDVLDYEVHRDEQIAHAVARVQRNKLATTRVEDEGRLLREALADTLRDLDKRRTPPPGYAPPNKLKFYTDPDPKSYTSDTFEDI